MNGCGPGVARFFFVFFLFLRGEWSLMVRHLVLGLFLVSGKLGGERFIRGELKDYCEDYRNSHC